MDKKLKHEELKQGGLKVYFRLLKYLRPNLLLFFVSVIGFWLMAATDALIVFFTGFLLDALENIDGTSTETVTAVGTENVGPFQFVADKFDVSFGWLPDLSPELTAVPVLVVLIYFLRGVGMFVGNFCLAVVAQRVIHKLRTELFDKLTVLPGTYFDRHDSGTLISKITFNVAQVNTALADAVKVILREGSSVIVVLAVLFYLRWDLTLVFIAIAPIIGLIVAVAGKHLRRYSNKVQAAMGVITSICGEMINGYRVMRTYGGEEYEKHRFENASAHNMRQNNKIAFTASLATSINQLFVALALGILMFIAIWVIDPNGAAEIVMYMMAVGLLPKSMKQLSDVYNKVQRGLAAAHSIFLQLDEDNEKDLGVEIKQIVQGRLEFKNVNFTYDNAELPAVNNINLSIEPGEVVAFVGASGSGKSTLVSLLPRYYDHSDGKILLDGTDINDYRLENLRQHIALVSQDVVLFNDTVRRNIAYGHLSASNEQEIVAAAESANAMEFIGQIPQKMDAVVGEDGSFLSGGQKQRLSIARALLKNAPVLILDEATSALDNESEKLIQAALEKVCSGRTTLIIAHRLSTIEKADKIVVMKLGEILEVGSHRELLDKNGEYAKLYNTQFRDDTQLQDSTQTQPSAKSINQ